MMQELLDYMFTFILMAAFCTKWPMLTELQVLGESEGDTVILWSPDFSIVLDSVLLPYGPRCWPNLNKYTDATDDNRDRYLVRGNKLYPIMKDGINELPLVKISKKQAKIELQDYPFYYNVKD